MSFIVLLATGGALTVSGITINVPAPHVPEAPPDAAIFEIAGLRISPFIAPDVGGLLLQDRF